MYCEGPIEARATQRSTLQCHSELQGLIVIRRVELYHPLRLIYVFVCHSMLTLLLKGGVQHFGELGKKEIQQQITLTV